MGIKLEDGDAIKKLLDEGTAVQYEIVSELLATPGAITDFTSRGPSLDGLLKPEIAGLNLYNDSAYFYYNKAQLNCKEKNCSLQM